jgi:hypothetical protein
MSVSNDAIVVSMCQCVNVLGLMAISKANCDLNFGSSLCFVEVGEMIFRDRQTQFSTPQDHHTHELKGNIAHKLTQ